MKFEWRTLKQVTHGRKLVDLPLCINNLHAPMPTVKKLKMN
jgi:hypothetical protein